MTPSLRDQLSDSPGELRVLVGFVCERVGGTDEAAALMEEVLACVDRDLGADYAWPGNVRELEQCVRNVLVRKRYHPRTTRAKAPTLERRSPPGLGAPET